jgi:hypothetical protein
VVKLLTGVDADSADEQPRSGTPTAAGDGARDRPLVSTPSGDDDRGVISRNRHIRALT